MKKLALFTGMILMVAFMSTTVLHKDKTTTQKPAEKTTTTKTTTTTSHRQEGCFKRRLQTRLHNE